MLLFEYAFPNQAQSLIGSWIIPFNLCDDLINEFEKKSEFHFQDESGFRNYTALPSHKIDPKLDQLYTTYVKECISKYITKYPHSHTSHTAWGISKPYNIQRYDPGKHYSSWHCETYGPKKNKLIRHLTWMTYLHDINDEGGTEFLYQNITSIPRKGLTLIWPAGWTHMHKGVPASVTKYIVTGWISFFERV